MTIKDFHDRVLFLLDKNSAEHITHEEIDRAADIAQMDVFIDYLGNPKTYQPGHPVPIMGFGQNQYINSALDPFRQPLDFLNTDTPGGVLTLPTNCILPISMYTNYYSSALGRNVVRPVIPVNEDTLIEALESQENPVTLYDPIALYGVNRKMQLYPEQPQAGRLFYLRRPKAPLYSYTTTNRVETHNPSNPPSQDLEWSDNIVGDIIAKTVKYIAIRIGNQELLQFGELRDKEGS